MEKRTIPIIALAVFSISLLSIFDFYTKPAIAQASIVRSADINLGGLNNKVFAMESNSLFVAISSDTSENYNVMSFLRSDVILSSGSGQISTVHIEPYVGGCNAVDNPCSSASGSGLAIFGAISEADESNWIGSAEGLWCGLTDCFTWWKTGNTTFPHQLQRWTYSNNEFELTGYMNLTGTWGLQSTITGIDTATGGIGGITVMTIRMNPASPTLQLLYYTGGTSLMGDVGSPSTLLASSTVNGMYACHPISHDNCSISQVAIAWGGTNDRFRIFNTATHAQICENSANTYDNSGYVTYNENTGLFVVSEDTNNGLTTFTQACVEAVPAGQPAYQNDVRGIAISEPTNLFYVEHGSDSALPITTQVSLTNYATKVNFDATTGNDITGWVSGNTQPYQNIAVDREHNSLMITGDTSSARIIYLTSFVDSEGGGGGAIDGVCQNGTALDCVGDRSTINQITGAQNFTTVIGNLGTQLGILNTTANTDPETNGSGLLLMLITGTFFASVVISSIAVANNKFGANIQYTEIPKEFWLFLVVGVVALSWYLNWVPDIVFYGMIVGLAGLFSFGLYRQYKGNG